MSETAEYLVVTGSAQDELHPSMEVCLEIASRGDRATLVIPSHLSSAIPLSFTSNPLVAVAPIASSSGLPTFLRTLLNCFASRDLEDYLEKRRTAGGGKLPRKLYAVVGPGAESAREVFRDFNVTVDPLPFVGLAIQRLSKAPASDVRPGEYRVLAVLPEGMVIVRSDLNIKPSGPPRGGPPCPGPRPGGGGGGPPKLGDRPPWPPQVGGSIGRMSNKSADPEQPFLDYMGYQTKMPVSGIGQLLAEKYRKMSGSVFDSSDRSPWPPQVGGSIGLTFNKSADPEQPFLDYMGGLMKMDRGKEDGRKSNFTDDEVIQWLDSKLRRSVLYVAFGSEVGPDEEELAQLAAAVEKSTRPFIWVVGSKSGGDFADGMEGRVGDRGLIIRGWAPHLLILRHPSTGGFLSHGGWNSMVEVVGQAVPLQAWPSRGDQHHNAKLVVSHRHPTMGKLFGWNSIAETNTHRSRFGTRPFPGKRYYNTDSPGDHHKVGHAASNDMPKNVMDDESKGIGKTVASEAFASFQFDLKFHCRIGRLQIGASISRLARSMH